MVKAVIFGGTTEGRKLCELCASNGVQVVYCSATGDGAKSVEALPGVSVSIGRLDEGEMAALLQRHKPDLAIDATHPYAEEASRNIGLACGRSNIRLIRVARESAAGDCDFRGGMVELLSWLEREPGNIFATLGSSSAEVFTTLTGWQSRVWMRILPSLDSLQKCLDAGYRPERLICMQGPFSEELNRAMFQSADAKILVTKDSGAAGGYAEKARAARGLGMAVAVLSKPDQAGGVTLEETCKILMEEWAK